MCALMIVKQWSPSQTLDEIDLNTSPFWVKIHGLPLKKRILKTAIVVGKGLGKLLEVENLEASGVICRHHLRVRVEILIFVSPWFLVSHLLLRTAIPFGSN